MPDYDVSKPVAIACDHAGPGLKAHIKNAFANINWLDLGTDGADSVDYPDYAAKLAAAIKDGQAERGVLICGSGIGISIAANRHAHIRCALVGSPELAALARQHNDANVLALGARFVTPEQAVACVDAFLKTPFEGGRHQKRVDKLTPC